jgi:hypothetical protein
MGIMDRNTQADKAEVMPKVAVMEDVKPIEVAQMEI